MNPQNTLLTAALGLIMSALSAQSASVPTYSVKDVGFLAGDTVMRGVAINFEGDIVGSAYTGFQISDPNKPYYYGEGGNQHGFLHHHGKLTDLGAGVIPVEINNSNRDVAH